MIRFTGKLRQFRAQSNRKLPFPAAPTLRIAQVSSAAVPFDLVEIFPSDRWHELETFRPGVLIGRAVDLQLLAQRANQALRSHSLTRSLDLSSVDHAVFLLTESGFAPATDVLRVVLWQTFGVPVYELLMGAGGRVLAAECEVHEGLHVESGAQFAIVNNELISGASSRKPLGTGLTAVIEIEACQCGRPGPRLMNIEQLAGPGNSRKLSATA